METATAIACPACRFEQDEGVETCLRCGVIFAKVRDTPTDDAASPAPAILNFDPDPIPALDGRWVAAALGSAVLAHLLAPIRFLLSPLVTLLHELGHAAAAWLLGCPAIPAFDFVYGGGVTHHQNFQLPIAMIIGGIWIWLGWTFRRNPRTLLVLGLCAGLWLVAVSRGWRRELVISAMGHGGELILAGILLWMALSGKGWRRPDLERPLGLFAAVFVQLQTMQFAWRLRNDPDFLAWYKGGKGGAMMNDLEVIALDLQIWTGVQLDIGQVAAGLLLFSLLPVATALLLYLFRDRVSAFGRSLLRLERSGL